MHLTVAEPLPWMRTLAQAHDALGGADSRGSRARACSAAPRRIGLWRINKRGCSVQVVGLAVHKSSLCCGGKCCWGRTLQNAYLPPAKEACMQATLSALGLADICTYSRPRHTRRAAHTSESPWDAIGQSQAGSITAAMQ